MIQNLEFSLGYFIIRGFRFRFMLPAITHIIENIHQQLLGKVILTGGDSPDCRNHFFYTGIFENEPLYSDIDHFIVILFIPVHRQHDHLQIRPDPQSLFRSFYPVHLGHFYIHQHQVTIYKGEVFNKVASIGSFVNMVYEILGRQKQFQSFPE